MRRAAATPVACRIGHVPASCDRRYHRHPARRAPHRICAYSTAVAADFHAFYRDCQVVGAEGEGVEASRLALCLATKRTIAAALDLLGISAPARM